MAKLRSLLLLTPLLLAPLLISGCGGKKGSLALKIVVGANDDPFEVAKQVRVTVGTHVKTADVNGGKFNLKVEFKPLKDPAPILVEALDANGAVFASGKTPPLPLVAGTSTEIAVWVGRPGTIVPAKAVLPSARTEMATATVQGLGAILAGGREATGGPIASTVIYNIYTHSIIETTPTLQARAGAVATGSTGARAIVFGGSTMGSIGAFEAPLATGELFDPSVGNGLWTPVPVEPTDARSFANATVLTSGATLVSGGLGATGGRLNSAAFLQTDSGTARQTAISTPMAAARVGHAVATARFPDGDGAILFGGLGADAATGIVAERLIGQSFSAYDLGLPNRDFASATTLPDGSVLITGGLGPSGVESSAIHIIPASPPQVLVIDGLLSVGRQHHTTTLAGDNVLICGGDDNAGNAHSTCDLITAGTLNYKTSLNMTIGRTKHAAIPLETGPILIAGGVGTDGKPVNVLYLYTP